MIVNYNIEIILFLIITTMIQNSYQVNMVQKLEQPSVGEENRVIRVNTAIANGIGENLERVSQTKENNAGSDT